MSVAYNMHGFDNDETLQDHLLEYRNQPQEMIASKVLGIVQVAAGNGKYPIIVPSEKNRIPSKDELANDGVSDPTMVTIDTREDTYQVKDEHTGAPITAREIKDYRNQGGVNPRLDAVETVSDKHDLIWESRAAELLNTPANWAGGHTSTPGTLWSAGGSDPVADIWAAIKTAAIGTLRKPTMFWSGYELYTVLAQHPAIQEFTKYTMGGFIPADLIASMFGMKEYHVSLAGEELSGQGATTQNLSQIWGKDFGIGYSPQRNAQGLTRKNSLCTAKLFTDLPPQFMEFKPKANTGQIITMHWSNDFKPTLLDNKESAGGKLIGGYLYSGAIA